MRIVQLTIEQFENFSIKHPLKNYCQTSYYAKLMGETGYNYDYVGYQDDNGSLIAASLILLKKISGMYKYAYAPKGFLIDYYNIDLLKNFLGDLAKYYKHNNVIFLKINPEIIIGETNEKKKYLINYNQNVNVIDDLKKLNFKRRREQNNFELIFPKITGFINLKTFNFDKLSKLDHDNINLARNKGLSLESLSSKNIDIFYNFVKDKTYNNINYYRNMLNSFIKDTSELLLVKVDYEKCLICAREEYEKELSFNDECNEKIQINNNEENLNEKMESDKRLLDYKNNIVEATEGLKNNKFIYIGGVIIIKYQNRVTIAGYGFDDNKLNLFPEYFLIDSLISRYKDDYEYLEFNALAKDFNDSGDLYEYNKAKLAFKPEIYESIGEFDLIYNELIFKRLLAKNLISKEFYPSYIVYKNKA